MPKATEPRDPMQDAKVGDGVTWGGYSDAYVGTIIARTPKTITVREDLAVLLNGTTSGEPDALQVTPGIFAGHTSGEQRWEYSPDPAGGVYKFSQRKVNIKLSPKTRYAQRIEITWRMVNQGHKGPALSPGRHKFYDFNF